MEKPKEKDRYRHFKGNEYEIVANAKHSETGEDLVIYRSLSNAEDVWARPLDMWNETVIREGQQIPRFKRMDPEPTESLQPEKVQLQTERLILRTMVPEDALAIFHNINHDKDVLQYFLAPYLEKEEDASVTGMIQSAARDGRLLLSIVLRETNEVIGLILQCDTPNAVTPATEVGYAIGKKYWGNGYCAEALREMIRFLFEQGIHKIVCSHFLPNKASERVMEKCGMFSEGIEKDAIFYHGKYWDLCNHAIINN